MIVGTPPDSVTIPAGNDSVTLTVETQNDSNVESNSVISVKLEAGTGYELGSTSEASVTMTDDDGTAMPELTITATAASITEGDDASFKVSADVAPTSNLTVNLSVGETGDMLVGTAPV